MATRMRGGRAPDSTSVTVPAPIGGLNDRDPIVSMPATDAIVLDNWWPEPGRVSVRPGSTLHARGLLGPVETITSYWPESGDVQVLAVAGGSIYDVTTSDEFQNAAIYFGLSSSRFQIAEATTSGGSYQLWFNGKDDALLYDGATFTPINDSSSPAITGVDTKDLIDGVVFKNRIFMVENRSMDLWYLPTTSISGAASSIPMGQIFRRGGHIVTAQPWTIDAGDGADDMLVVLSSNGEAAVFSGVDPDEASSWRLVGVFYIGRPVGRRPCLKLGGDLLIICEDGVFPLSGALQTASVDGRVAITDKIQNTIRRAAVAAKDVFGWQLCLSPGNTALILNVPEPNGGAVQYVQNTLTGAWARFTGWEAQSWVDTPIGLFYGCENGCVFKAWESPQDDGINIVADAVQAFSTYGVKSTEKYFHMFKPYIESNGAPSIVYSFCGDFVIEEPEGEMTYRPIGGMVWGSMAWGSMVWGGMPNQIHDWRATGKIAKTGAPRIRVQNNASSVRWSATEVMFTRGWHL